MSSWKIAGVNFDHMHMGDNLRMAAEHPDTEIVGVCDENRPRSAESIDETAERLDVSTDRRYGDVETCLTESNPDIVLLCPATAEHAEWVERIAPHDVHIILEKPFASTLQEADRIIAAMERTDKRLVVNWPLVWYPPHRTTKRLIDEGAIGEVTEVHYYGGNQGPLHHMGDKRVRTAEEAAILRDKSWFYDEELGGGSLLDYLGYGAVISTWFRSGELPEEVTTTQFVPGESGVDEQSVTVAQYEHGLSTLETRWGTFTDPWENQTQPKCGFVVAGTEGTISSYDYEDVVTLQTSENPAGQEIPVDEPTAPNRNPVEHLIDTLETGGEIDGPLTVELNRKAQQILETARLSAAESRTLSLRE